jgi:hypothetical protein
LKEFSKNKKASNENRLKLYSFFNFGISRFSVKLPYFDETYYLARNKHFKRDESTEKEYTQEGKKGENS